MIREGNTFYLDALKIINSSPGDIVMVETESDLDTLTGFGPDTLAYTPGFEAMWQKRVDGQWVPVEIGSSGSGGGGGVVPTRVSQLTNDSGYQTALQVSDAIAAALTDYPSNTDIATDDKLGLIKTDSAKGIKADATTGKLSVDGRFDNEKNGTVYKSNTAQPSGNNIFASQGNNTSMALLRDRAALLNSKSSILLGWLGGIVPIVSAIPGSRSYTTANPGGDGYLLFAAAHYDYTYPDTDRIVIAESIMKNANGTWTVTYPVSLNPHNTITAIMILPTATASTCSIAAGGVVKGEGSAAIGLTAAAIGNGSLAAGEHVSTNADASFVFGTNNVNEKKNGIVGGLCNDTENSPEGVAVFGNYADATGTVQMAVGGGSVAWNGAITRKNLFQVNTDGTATVAKDPVNDMDVVTKRFIQNTFGFSSYAVAD